MKAIVTCIGSSGDTFPITGIGLELQRRGYDVTVLANDHFAPLIEGCGLSLDPIGTDEEYRTMMADPDLWHPMKGFRAVIKPTLEHLLPRIHQKLTKLREAGEAFFVVAHSLDFASLCWQEKHGTPVATVHLAPTLFRTVYEMPTMTGTINATNWPRVIKQSAWWMTDRFMIDPVMLPGLNAFRAGMGLGPVKRPFAGWIHSPLLTLGLFPEWFAARQPDYPPQLRQTSFPLFEGTQVHPVPEELSAFLASGTPPIAFTPGSAVRDARQFMLAAIEACERLDRRGVILAKFADLPRALPETVKHFAFAPLGQFLSRCAALVHHGGIGTTAAGFAAGVPQVVMPMSHDQPDHAARVTKLGVGDRLFPKKFTGRNLAEKLNALLHSTEVRRKCAEYAKRCADRDGIREACDHIENAVRSRAGARSRVGA